MAQMEGRFYEAEFPELEEVVVVQVKRIVEMGAYVSLLEYDGKEGMMLLSELSKRRIRSVAQLLRVGRTEICMVLRVDEEKGYVDLSKRRVDPEDAARKAEQFAKAKAVHGIMRHVAQVNDVPVEELCQKVSWPLYAKYQDAHEAFRKHINEELNLWQELDFSQPGQDLSHVAEKIQADIDVHLRRRLVQQILRMRAKVEVACSEYDGIDAVKGALLKGLEVSKEDCELRANLVAHPLFVLTCTCHDKQQGQAAIDDAMRIMQEEIEKRGGTFLVKSLPALIGQDEKEQEDDVESVGDRGSDSTESEQDETMGAIDEKAMAELMEKTKELDVNGD